MAGVQCCDDPPALNSSSGHGFVSELGGFKTYVSGSSNSKSVVLLISDIFGYEAPKVRKISNKVAAAGYYVVVPDFFFNGDPFNPENKERFMQVWLLSHGTDKGLEDTKMVIAALKDKGISAIGAAGFCWGAKVVFQFAKSDNIQAAVLLHPSFVSADYVKEVKAPIVILGAEIGKQYPPELLKQFEEILSYKPEVDSFVKIYPGVAQGWTVRYNVEDNKDVQSAEEAHQDMLDWFNKNIIRWTSESINWIGLALGLVGT